MRRETLVLFAASMAVLGLGACCGPCGGALDGAQTQDPEAICAKLEELTGGKSERAACLSNLEKAKADDPERFACSAACIEDSGSMKALKKCDEKCDEAAGSSGEKEGGAPAAAKPAKATKIEQAVDALDRFSVKAKLKGKRYELMSEKTAGKSWRGTVKVGDARRHEVLNVVLSPVSGKKDGRKLMATITKGLKAPNYQGIVGEKQLLLVNCVKSTDLNKRKRKTGPCRSSSLKGELIKTLTR